MAAVGRFEHDPYARQRRAALRTAVILGVLALVLYIGYFFFVRYLH
ncbi:MAG: hypothetical protein ACRETQ_13435 [Gammaproteobacteria bacterium]